MDPPAPSRHPYPRFVKDHFTGSCTCGILAPRSVGGWPRLPPAFPPRHRQGENTMVRTIGLWSVLMLALACPAWAQVQSGSVLVKVVDDQGAVVPGVTVTLTSPVLPRPLVGVTDSAGVQRFTALTIGTYSIKTTLTGFQTITREGVRSEERRVGKEGRAGAALPA